MVDTSILRPLRFCQELSDAQVERMADAAELVDLGAGEYLNKRKRSADYFYVILDGSVRLEQQDVDGNLIPLETLFQGTAIGISSLIDRETRQYMSDARALMPTTVLQFKPDNLMRLFYQDFELGFLVMKKVALIARDRLIYRTRPLENLPDVKRVAPGISAEIVPQSSRRGRGANQTIARADARRKKRRR